MSNETKARFDFVLDALRGAQTVQVMSLGLELGLLRALADAPGTTPDALAAALELHAPYVRVWCETAYAFGVLERAGAGYALPERLETILLDPNHARYLGGFVMGMTTWFADDFRQYPNHFREGTTYPFSAHGAAFSAWVSTLTHPMQRLVVAKILPERFGAQLTAGIDVLDFGSGAGQLLFKLGEAYPNSRYTGVDIDPHGISVAQHEAARRDMNHFITFQRLDERGLLDEAKYDLVILFETLHELDPGIRRGIVWQTLRALRPGGHIFIVDETWADAAKGEDLRSEAYRMAAVVQWSELIWGNVVLTADEQTALLSEAGYIGLERADLGGTITVLVARKPAS